jgi:hypothetical protein
VHLPDDKPDYTLAGILKSILISRNAPEGKYSTTPTKISIICQPLSTKQQDILSFLRDSAKSLKNYKEWSKLRPDEIDFIIKEDKHYIELRIQYLKDISEAIKNWLITHHLVHNFFYTYVVTGNKEMLRLIKRGLETIADRPIKQKDINFVNYLGKIKKYRNEGKTWPQIRRILMKRKVIKNISCQALRKKVAKYAPHILIDN